MKKRSVSFGTYITADHGWTVTGITLSDPEQKLNYVDKVGGDGSWDLSTTLTDGIPTYKNRTLTVTMELSVGSRDDREQIINNMVAELNGLEQSIVLPDRPEHYLTGRTHVSVKYSDLAHAAVAITANVEPWFYCSRERLVEVTAAGETGAAHIYNCGSKHVVPLLAVTGSLQVQVGEAVATLEAGAYKCSFLRLAPGLTSISYTGTGTLSIAFREAVLR